MVDSEPHCGTVALHRDRRMMASTRLRVGLTLKLEAPSGQVRSGQVRSGQVRSGQVRSGQVRSGNLSSYCHGHCGRAWETSVTLSGPRVLLVTQ
jgi:hypothetical protein